VRRSWVVAGCLLAACSDPSIAGTASTTAPTTTASPSTAPTLPASIHCTVQYRPDGDHFEGTDERELDVPQSLIPRDGQTLTFERLAIRIEFSTFDLGQTVLVIVTSPDGIEVERVLFQGADEILHMGGLHDVRNGTAQLQWFCEPHS
jgi:hypothetical protein